MINAILQSVTFEIKRSFTIARAIVLAGISLIPSLLMLALQLQARGRVPDEAIAVISYYMIIQVGCVLGLILWATPTVGSEIEAQTWIYYSMRRHGKTALLVSKYSVAILWSCCAAFVSCMLMTMASQYPDPLRFFAVLFMLSVIGSFAFAGLYSLIGVVFIRRSLVFAAVYSLVVEVLIANVPVTIGKITVGYRLRSLMVQLLDLNRIQEGLNQIYGEESIVWHLCFLAVYTVVACCLALYIANTKEYSIAVEA